MNKEIWWRWWWWWSYWLMKQQSLEVDLRLLLVWWFPNPSRDPLTLLAWKGRSNNLPWSVAWASLPLANRAQPTDGVWLRKLGPKWRGHLCCVPSWSSHPGTSCQLPCHVDTVYLWRGLWRDVQRMPAQLHQLLGCVSRPGALLHPDGSLLRGSEPKQPNSATPKLLALEIRRTVNMCSWAVLYSWVWRCSSTHILSVPGLLSVQHPQQGSPVFMARWSWHFQPQSILFFSPVGKTQWSVSPIDPLGSLLARPAVARTVVTSWTGRNCQSAKCRKGESFLSVSP